MTYGIILCLFKLRFMKSSQTKVIGCYPKTASKTPAPDSGSLASLYLQAEVYQCTHRASPMPEVHFPPDVGSWHYALERGKQADGLFLELILANIFSNWTCHIVWVNSRSGNFHKKE